MYLIHTASSLPPQPWRLGLTGGMGCGKSTVLRMFADFGADTIDADELSRQTTAVGGPAMPAIAHTFGHHFLTAEGALNRDKMRALVFTNPQARKQLEAIIHPLVTTQLEAFINRCTQPCVVLDIPLLIESKIWRPKTHQVLLVDCPRETQIERVSTRSHWPRDTIEAVITTQACAQDRRQASDWVIWNEGISLETLRHQVKMLSHTVGL